MAWHWSCCAVGMHPQRARKVLEIGLVPLGALMVSGCAAVEGIFKAGVWVGVLAVAIVLAVAFGIVRMLNR